MTLATHCTWFGGSYQNKPNQFAMFAIDLEHVPEAVSGVQGAARAAQGRARRSAGRDRRQGHGDALRLEDRRPRADPGRHLACPSRADTWYFNIDGIYDGDKTVDKTQFFFRYDYFDENRRGGKGNVGWYIIKIDDPSQAAADRGEARRACSRTRRPRRRPRPRRPSSPTSRSRSATSAR